MAVPAQNREPDAAPPKKVRGRPFLPGNNANPGGRPKGLAAAVRERAPADELADYQLAIFHRDVAALKRFKIALKEVTLAERTKAHEWLSERGYGKAPAFAPVEGGDPLERDETDQALAEVADELAARRDTRGDREDRRPADETTGAGAAPDGAVASAGAD